MAQTSDTGDFSRRSVIAIGVAAAAGLTAGVTTGAAAAHVLSEKGSSDVGSAIEPFFGKHQSGIATPLQAHGWFVAFKLRADIDDQAVARLLRLWTTDIALLMSGKPAMADSNPEIAAAPARLTVSVGLGRAAFVAAMAGEQVAVVAPTTLLARQHYSGFVERFGAEPAEWHSAAGSKARRRAWRCAWASRWAWAARCRWVTA